MFPKGFGGIKNSLAGCTLLILTVLQEYVLDRIHLFHVK